MPVPRTPVVSFCRLSMSKPLAALSLFLIRFIPFQLVILFVRISLEYCLTTLQHGIFDSTHSTFTDCLSLQFSVSRFYSSAPDCTLFFPCLSFHPFPFYQLTDWTACRYYLSLEESQIKWVSLAFPCFVFYCFIFYSVFKQLGLQMLATSRTDHAGFWVIAWQWMDLALFFAFLAHRHHRHRYVSWKF